MILRTLYRQMYELGFISSDEIDENTVYIGLLPKFAANPVAETVEAGLIPQDVLDAFQEMSLIRNPCGDRNVKLRAWEKLQTMTNPRTGRKYTLNQAQRVLNEMCRMMRRLGSRQDALKKYFEEP